MTEKCGPAVNEKLAEVVTNILANGIDSDTITEKSKAYERPQNMAMLDITRVEPLVWDIIQSDTRSADIKLQKIQASITRGLMPLILAAQKCVEANTHLININDVFPAMSDSIAFLADATHTQNLLRRDSIKADLKPDFKALCAHKNPVGTTLFGDEVEKQIKEIGETHKIANRAASRPQSSRGFSYAYRGGGGMTAVRRTETQMPHKAHGGVFYSTERVRDQPTARSSGGGDKNQNTSPRSKCEYTYMQIYGWQHM